MTALMGFHWVKVPGGGLSVSCHAQLTCVLYCQPNWLVRKGVSVTVTDLAEIQSVPLNLHDGYVSALNSALALQEDEGWVDYLLPFADAVAVSMLLVGNNVGNFTFLESNTDSQRWIWMSPDADEFARRQMPRVFAHVQDASLIDPWIAFACILTDLGRDMKGRKIHAANVAA